MTPYRTLALFFALVASGFAQGGEPLNVLVIVADDLGYMDIGAYNPETFYETPNVDALAKSGMRFTDGYASCPVCSPSRYSLMTGRYPAWEMVTNYFTGRRKERFAPAPLHNKMPLKETTNAEHLKKAGYATFFAGKWHLGPDTRYWPKAQGFDVNAGGHRGGGPYGGKKYFSPYGNPNLTDGPDGEHLPDRLASETNKFIEANKDGRFLAFLSFYSVHTPLIGRPDLVAKYRERAKKINGTEFAPEEQVFLTKRKRKVRILQKHAVYAAMVEAMDQAVGKVLKKLDELGLREKTLVVFTSDNGGLSTSEGSPTSNLPLRGGKGWVYEGGIREPFIVRWPGKTKAGSTSREPVCGIDLLPTTLAAIGSARRTMSFSDGISLVPALEGGALKDRPLFWHYPHYGNQGGFPGGAVRQGRWKLIQRYEDGRVHLYDLQNDLAEKTDVAADHPERVATMKKTLYDWYFKVDARFLQRKTASSTDAPWRPER